MLPTSLFSFDFGSLSSHAVVKPNLDFALFHEETSYPCNSLIAGSFSRAIHFAVLADPLTTELQVSSGTGPFALVQQFLLGGDIEIDQGNAAFLLSYACELQIDLLIAEVFESGAAVPPDCLVRLCRDAFENGSHVRIFVQKVAEIFDLWEPATREFPLELYRLIVNANRSHDRCNANSLRGQIARQFPYHRVSKVVGTIEDVPRRPGHEFDGILARFPDVCVRSRLPLEFDFGPRFFVCVSEYSIGEGPSGSWNLLASEDGDRWVVIDEQERRGLAQTRWVESFSVRDVGIRARFVKIAPIRPFTIGRIEFFGTIEVLS
jgi:hypothetical protein